MAQVQRHVGQVGLLPAVAGASTAIALVIPFVISVVRGDSSPDFPFLSEIGRSSPESGVLSLFLVVAAVSGFGSYYFRHRLVDAFSDEAEEMAFLNNLALWVGILSSIGMVTIACFPLNGVHLVNCVAYYVWIYSSVAYTLLQTFITYAMYPQSTSLCSCLARLCIAIIALISAVASCVAWVFGNKIWNSASHEHDRSHKLPLDQGFTALVFSGVCEWIVLLCFIAFHLSFVRDFQKVRIIFRVIPLVENLAQDVSIASERQWLLYGATDSTSR